MVNDNEVNDWVESFRGTSEWGRFNLFMEYYDRLYQFEAEGNQEEVNAYKTLIQAIRQIDDLGTPTHEEAKTYDDLRMKIAGNYHEIRECKKAPNDYRGSSVAQLENLNDIYEEKKIKIWKRMEG